MKQFFILATACMLLSSGGVLAASRYWVGTGNWNVAANWSATSGGAGGAGVPGSTDDAIFNGGGTNNCSINAAVNVLSFQMLTGYTGTVTQNSNTVTAGASGMTLQAGTFSGSSSSITVNGHYSNSGCAFTSTSATLIVQGNFSLTGTGSFTNNSGTVELNYNASFTTVTLTNSTSGSPTALNNLTINPSSAKTHTIASGSTFTVNGTLTISGAGGVTINTGSIDAKGDITITNTVTGAGGSATINIVGTGTQTLTGSGSSTGGGALPHVSINKSSGTLNLSSIITCAGNWVYTQGTVSPGTSSVLFTGNFNVDCQGTSSNMSFYNFGVLSGTRTLTGALDIDNNNNIASGSTLSAGSYNINIGGNWKNQGGTWTPGTAAVIFDGSGYKTLGKTSATETFNNVTVNRSGGTIELTGIVQVNGTVTLTAGKIKTKSAKYLLIPSGGSISGGSNTAYVYGPMYKGGNTSFTFPIGDSAAGSVPYHPLAITAPSVSTDAYMAEYKASGYGNYSTTALASVSNCEYWTLERKNGTSNVTATLNWNSNCSNISYSEMRVASWNGSAWADLGQGAITATYPTGSITASSACSFSTNPTPLTIGYAIVSKSYAILKKKIDGGYYNTEGNVLYFNFDEEYKDTDSKLSYRIVDKNNTPVTLMTNQVNVNTPVSYGSNLYKLDLYDNANAVLSTGMYLLEVSNEKNEKWYLRFNKN